MKLSLKNNVLIENTIYILLWVLIFLIPVFSSGYEFEINWKKVYHEWLRFIPFLLIFIINNSILIPVFLYKKKNLQFIIGGLLVVLLISYLGINTKVLSLVLENSDAFEKRPPKGFPPPFRRPVQPLHIVFINSIVISILIIGFNTAIKLSYKWSKNEQEKKELEKEHLQSELNFLKHQISPHFFMNTLNNIHALIDIDAENAKSAVIRLSKMMRHLLYDAEQEKTSLKKEIEFIKTFVDLMKLRFSSKVSIEANLPEVIEDYQIPPLLFTSLLENAFKYGVSYREKSFIKLNIDIEKLKLIFELTNSDFSIERTDEKGGIGHINLKKRLDLLFLDNYILDINRMDKQFSVKMVIPLKNGNI